MLICEFTIDDPETRAANAAHAQERLAALNSGEWDGSQPEEEPGDEEEPVEETMPETEEEPVVEAPDILGDLLDED